MKSGSGNVYYVLELITALSAVSFLVVRKVMEDRRSRTTRKAALKTMAGGKLDKNYEPHLQSGNCIVAATCNILWYHGKNGFPELIDGIVRGYFSYTVEHEEVYSFVEQCSRCPTVAEEVCEEECCCGIGTLRCRKRLCHRRP